MTLVYGDVCMKGQIQTQKYGSIKTVFRILVHDANLLPKNMVPNFVYKTRIPYQHLLNMFYTSSKNDFKPNWCTCISQGS